MKQPVIFLCLALMFITCFMNAALSQTTPDALQLNIRKAIDKVYPATVKIREYDTLRNLARNQAFSGVVISSEGYILTAAHAMKPKQIYLISFPDGSTTTAEGWGRIGPFDAGSLKIRKKGNYAFAELGESSGLKPGQTVISLGYPYTMDSGILPVVRAGTIKNNIINSYIQSSCLMEPGDSGGPLFDLKGKIVGIHSHILHTGDENFEVPIAIFHRYWPSLSRQGNYLKEDLQTTDLRSAGLIAGGNEADTSLSVVKIQLDQHNSNLSNYSYMIQSEFKEGGRNTNSVLLALSRSGRKNDSKCYLLSSSSSIGANPVVIEKQKQLTALVIKRDTINDLVLLEVDGLKPAVAGVKTDSRPIELMPGSFALSPVKNKIKIGVIGAGPFRPGPNAVRSQLPATEILLQDAPLTTGDCGGPVFDSNQRFVGLNLKRYNRTSVVIVPYAAIQEFIRELPTDKQSR